MLRIFSKIFKQIISHKLITGIILVLIILGGYFGYKNFVKKEGETRYLLAAVEKGTLIVSISGTGQVSGSNEVDLSSKTSGDLVYLNAEVGQSVSAGTLIAQVDATNAAFELETARISYDELVTIDEDELRDAKDALEQADTDLKEAYIDARAALASAATNMADVMAELDNLFDGYLSTSNRSDLSKRAIEYIDRAEDAYYDADDVLDEFSKTYRSVSNETNDDTIESLISDANQVSMAIAQAAKYTKDAVVYLRDRENNDQTSADEAYSTVDGLVTTANATVSDTLSAKNSILNSKKALKNAEIDLEDLEDGPDTLDLRSEELSLREKQQAYADCFIRAPFDGVIADVSARKGDTVSSGTVIATLITKQKIAEISLNEVDVANIKVGQKATLTFDALPDLTISGEVVEVDMIGTVSQGVVSYGVKIVLDTDEEQIKSGMSITADIITDIGQDVLALPNSAIKSQGDYYYVELTEVPEENKQQLLTSVSGVILPQEPKIQVVEIGLSNDSSTEIISGLNEGDIVVTSTLNQNKTQTTQSSQTFGTPGGKVEMFFR